MAHDRVSHVLIAGLLASAAALAQNPPASKDVTPQERAAFETVIRDYIVQHPGVIRDALDALKGQEAAAAAAKAKAAVAAERPNLVGDPDSPWIGSDRPDVTIVEFFDYHCGFCKQIAPALVKLTETDPKVRVVLKNFPILGPESIYAAKVSLAARKSPKFAALHAAMLASATFTPENMRKILADAGVDPAVLTEADSPEIQALVDRIMKLASELTLSATPSLVIGDVAAPGAVSYEALTAMVAEERKKQSTPGQ